MGSPACLATQSVSVFRRARKIEIKLSFAMISSIISRRLLHTTAMTRHAEKMTIIQPEPHTFMTQKRPPFHHFVNFVKFASLGYGIVYVGQRLVKKLQKKD